jgi:OOP family OmpA-OmpF porin
MRLAANRGSLLMMLAMLLGIVFVQRIAAANLPVPAEVSFLPGMLKLYNPPTYEPWNEMRFPDDQGKLLSGKHWYMAGKMAGAADKMATWNAVKTAVLAHGWTLIVENLKQPVSSTFHFTQNGVEAWANIVVGDQDHVWVDVMEPGPLPYTLALVAPQAKPEKIDPEKGDFPYLISLPGSKLRGGGLDAGAFSVTPEGTNQPEVVASGSINKRYEQPEGLTNALFMTEYRTALVKAGWVIAKQSNSSDAGILAHYTQQGRNLWASLHKNNDGYNIQVGDAGATDLRKALSSSCHVALYGVLFDFNKATLLPASDPVLKQVQALLTADMSIKIEVQGHTDNVGTDAYNQTLSEARARSVVTWLTQHGVATDRLSAKGYGKMKPVADNGNDEGRAKNRRVEIADPRCMPNGK